jgi:hypothetical protein
MSARAFTLIAMTALLLLPAVQAGDKEHPEIADGADDVQVNGGANCQAGPCVASMDFFWPAADLANVWVGETNDTLTFTVQMKSGSAFAGGNEAVAVGTAQPFTYVYTFAFELHGHEHMASATWSGGSPAAGDMASAAIIVGNELTVVLPKVGMMPGGEPVQAGDVVSKLVLTAHGASGSMTVDDRAPDANTGPDYVVLQGAGNGTAPADDGGDELKMPGPAAPVLGLALVGLVAMLRRRD